jgi:hypothetical protein
VVDETMVGFERTLDGMKESKDGRDGMKENKVR